MAMAAELDLEPLGPPPLNPAITNTSSAVTATVTTPAQTTPIPPENPVPKRQRRPSVRLGEIGDLPATHTYDSHMRRPKHSYSKLSKETPNQHQQTLTLASSKSSAKARSLTHLVNGNSPHDSQLQHQSLTLDSNFDFGHHRRLTKPRKPVSVKRVRSNWASKLDDPAVNDSSKDNNNSKGDEDDDDDDELENVGFRDYDHESDSPIKENSPVHSGDDHNNNNDLDGDLWQRRSGRGGFGSDFDAPESNYKERKGFGGVDDGVRNWLEELGLGRYTPVFEIHEVDDEVLPMLTLEDLKDMGINAVGSRRKMFSAIQKLRKGIS